jgi:hypothetical protein
MEGLQEKSARESLTNDKVGGEFLLNLFPARQRRYGGRPWLRVAQFDSSVIRPESGNISTVRKRVGSLASPLYLHSKFATRLTYKVTRHVYAKTCSKAYISGISFARCTYKSTYIVLRNNSQQFHSIRNGKYSIRCRTISIMKVRTNDCRHLGRCTGGIQQLHL